MIFHDLREYIRLLDQKGEAVHIKQEVDWHLELGAIIRRSYDLKAPAPLFEKIKDYPQGFRILGAPIGTSSLPNQYFSRLALSLDMPADFSYEQIVNEYNKKRGRQLIPPVWVPTGPCKENILLGDEIDLFKFPVPYVHEGDGGRYIGSWHIVVTKDPDSGWVNWGMYRLMVVDRTTMTGLLRRDQHIGQHYYQKYEARNKPMEFAAAIGTEPVSSIVGATRVPAGVDEADVAGGLRGRPVELVKCETVDLSVPATSEIVIEGIVPPHERLPEGPFGEYTGYLSRDNTPKPVFRVTAITHRNDPIQVHSCMGVPVDDSAVVTTVIRAANILEELKGKGFPVRMVYCPPETVSHMAVISTEVPFANFAKYLACAVWGSNAGRTIWYLVVVDKDIDPTRMDQVLWALTSRCHPQRGIFSMGSSWGMALPTFLSRYERENGLGSQVLFDCTWPKEWPKEEIPKTASFEEVWPKEIQEKVIKNWQRYGFAVE
jgi:phenylphosphate carboxylase alpha subunit